jgi:hypothetical protein
MGRYCEFERWISGRRAKRTASSEPHRRSTSSNGFNAHHKRQHVGEPSGSVTDHRVTKELIEEPAAGCAWLKNA